MCQVVSIGDIEINDLCFGLLFLTTYCKSGINQNFVKSVLRIFLNFYSFIFSYKFHYYIVKGCCSRSAFVSQINLHFLEYLYKMLGGKHTHLHKIPTLLFKSIHNLCDLSPSPVLCLPRILHMLDIILHMAS